MRFDQKLMNYAISEDLTKRKITNCNNLIFNYIESCNNQLSVYQVIALNSMLKTMKKRIEKNYPDLLQHFNFLLNDLLEEFSNYLPKNKK